VEIRGVPLETIHGQKLRSIVWGVVVTWILRPQLLEVLKARRKAVASFATCV